MVEIYVESFGLLTFICGLCVGITSVLVCQAYAGGNK